MLTCHNDAQKIPDFSELMTHKWWWWSRAREAQREGFLQGNRVTSLIRAETWRVVWEFPMVPIHWNSSLVSYAFFLYFNNSLAKLSWNFPCTPIVLLIFSVPVNLSRGLNYFWPLLTYKHGSFNDLTCIYDTVRLNDSGLVKYSIILLSFKNLLEAIYHKIIPVPSIKHFPFRLFFLHHFFEVESYFPFLMITPSDGGVAGSSSVLLPGPLPSSFR